MNTKGKRKPWRARPEKPNQLQQPKSQSCSVRTYLLRQKRIVREQFEWKQRWIELQRRHEDQSRNCKEINRKKYKFRWVLNCCERRMQQVALSNSRRRLPLICSETFLKNNWRWARKGNNKQAINKRIEVSFMSVQMNVDPQKGETIVSYSAA